MITNDKQKIVITCEVSHSEFIDSLKKFDISPAVLNQLWFESATTEGKIYLDADKVDSTGREIVLEMAAALAVDLAFKSRTDEPTPRT